jgi:hypothetical protein
MIVVDTPQSPVGWESRVPRRKVGLRGGSVIEQKDGIEGDLAPSAEDAQGTAVRQEWRLGHTKTENYYCDATIDKLAHFW